MSEATQVSLNTILPASAELDTDSYLSGGYLASQVPTKLVETPQFDRRRACAACL